MRERLGRVMAALLAMVVVVTGSPMVTLAQESGAVYAKSQQTEQEDEKTTQMGQGEEIGDTDAEGDYGTIPTATPTADSGEKEDDSSEKESEISPSATPSADMDGENREPDEEPSEEIQNPTPTATTEAENDEEEESEEIKEDDEEEADEEDAWKEIVVEKNANTVTAASATYSEGVQNKINQILQKYPTGSYFSANGAACSHGASEVCDNCCIVNIDNEAYSCIGNKCWTCKAFANSTFYRLFGIKMRETGNTITDVYSVNSLIGTARTGDFIACFDSSGNEVHAGIYLRGENGTFYLYESNVPYQPNRVSYGEYSHTGAGDGWSWYRVFHAKNYEDINASAPSVSYSTYGTGGSRGSVSETNATLYSVITTNARSGITVGLRIGTSSGNWNVKTHEEAMSSYGYNQLNNTGYVETWFECNSELGVTLSKGTTYYYQFYMKINGTEYADSVRSFKTTGTAADTTKPTVSNLKISDITNKGYWISCTVSDNVGVKTVKFKTKINGGSYTTTTGTLSGSTAKCYITASAFTSSSAQFTTDVYAYDAAGNVSDYARGTVYIDQNKPVVTDMKIYDVTKDGYWISCTVSDNVGVKTVKFKTKINGGSYTTTTGTLSDNTAKCYIKVSDFTSSSAQFTTDIYAYDAAGNVSDYARDSVFVDQDKPVVSDMKIYDVTKDGYWVSCKVSDNVGVTNVKFPTWISGWSESQIHWLEGTLNGDTATCYVKASDFTTESIRFVTDIRAYDAAGNGSDYARDGVTIDQNAPTISDIQIEAENAEGCTISCKVEDDYSDIAKVCVLTDADSEDGWQDNAQLQGTLQNGRYVFDVSYADFDDVMGEYTISICAVDTWGNESIQKYTHKVRGDVLDEDIPQDEDIPNGIWIAGLTQQTYIYTGKAIKPEVRVYDKNKLLTAGKDYSISYKNNTKANDASVVKSAPTITVTGKGNYSGKDTVTFVIEQKNIADEDVVADNMVVKATGKKLSPVPTITYNGKKLTNKKDFTVTYPNEEEGAYKDGGTYTILVTGKGNYVGTREITLTITEQKLVSKLSVSKIASRTYTGEVIEPEVTVKDGKKTLVKDTDYTVSFENNIEVGTATAIITGMGDYAGTKKVAFKITANASLAKAKITLWNESGLSYTGAVYTGSEVKPDRYTVSITVGSGQEARDLMLTEGTDYTVTYQNNVKVGTATVTFKGINGYSGSQKKTYKIMPVDLAFVEMSGGLSVGLNTSYVYEKAGCKPEPIVTYNGTQLTKGTDYTLSYKNNTAVNDGSNEKKIPTVTIKGKGNYKGTIARNYQITQQEISGATLTVKDIVWKNKSGIYKVSPVIKDINGKTLSAGTDYEKQIAYTYENDTILNETTTRTAGEAVGAKDIIPAGTIIRVTVKAKAGGNYTGSISGTYRITKASIANAKVTIPAQTYTGKAVRVDDVMVVKMNGNVLSSDNYAIVGYKNNVNKGTASVTIRGLNDCGGTKTIQFKIRQRKLLWWWNN